MEDYLQQQQDDNRDKYLKYGDRILLKSNEPPYMYLTARSSYEESVFMVHNQIHEQSFLEYPNFSEMIFTIYPKLHCQETKKYQKARRQGTLDESMEELFQRRLKAESDLNEKRVKEQMGTYVAIGDEVQLMHISSQTFVKATTEKNQKTQDLFYLKLSQQPSKESHFHIKINPFMNFKKTGERISYEDSFFFDIQTFKSVISMKDLPLTVGNTKGDDEALYSKSPSKSAIQDSSNYIQQYPLGLPHIMENLAQFQTYDAGHKREDITASIFQAKKILSFDALNDRSGLKPLRYGSYIRLKHITKQHQKQGYMSSEFNICGVCPEVRMVSEAEESEYKVQHEPSTSIFQVLPLHEDEMGKIIEFEDLQNNLTQGVYQQGGIGLQAQNTINQGGTTGQLTGKKGGNIYGKIAVRLRHVISGRYLILDQEKGQAYLSETFDSIIYKLKAKSLGKNQKTNFFSKNGKEAQEFQDKAGNIINIQQKIQSLYDEFCQKIEIIIESTSQEDTFLQLSSMFSIKKSFLKKEDDNNNLTENLHTNMNQNEEGQLIHKFLKVDQNDDTFNIDNNFQTREHLMELDFIEKWIGQPVFASMNPMGDSNYELNLVDGLGDYFFFTLVDNEELNNLEIIHGLIYPILLLNSSLKKDNTGSGYQNNFKLCSQELTKIGLWLCGISIENKQPMNQITQLPIAERQYLIRESGITDMLVKLVSDMMENNLFNEDIVEELECIENFTKDLLDFLALMTDANKPNSFYIFQWYSLFKKIILTSNVAKMFRFDILVNSWLNQLEIQMSFKNDLKEIASQIKFSEMNLNALNLLTAFVGYNEYRAKVDQEEITEELMKNDQIRGNIFRKLAIGSDDENLVIQIDDTEDGEYPLTCKMDDNDEEQNEIQMVKFLCTSAILNMLIELCKGGPQYVIGYISELYPIGLCKQIFIDGNIHNQFRSLFISLFIESYINIDLRYNRHIHLPQTIKLSKGIRPSSKAYYKMIQVEKMVAAKYENREFNLKIILNEYLQQLEDKMIEEHVKVLDKDPGVKGYTLRKHDLNLLTKSHLQLCKLLLLKGFYYVDECEELKGRLVSILASMLNVYRVLVGDEGPEQKDDNGNKGQDSGIGKSIPIEMCKNALEIVECLEIIDNILLHYQLIRYSSINQEQKQKFKNLKKKTESQFKLEKLMKFIDANLKITNEDHETILLLHELMILDYQKLNAKIMDYLFNKFSQKKQFIQAASKSLLIDESNVHYYDKFVELYYNIHFGVIDLKYSSFSSNDEIQHEYEIYKNLNAQVIELIKIIFQDDKSVEENRAQYNQRKQQFHKEAGNNLAMLMSGNNNMGGKKKGGLNLFSKSDKKVDKKLKNAFTTPTKNNQSAHNLAEKKQDEKELGFDKMKTLDQYSNKLGPQAKINSQHIFLLGHKKSLEDDLPSDNQSEQMLSSHPYQPKNNNNIDLEPKIDIINSPPDSAMKDVDPQKPLISPNKSSANQSQIPEEDPNHLNVSKQKKTFKLSQQILDSHSQNNQDNVILNLVKTIYYTIGENYHIQLDTLRPIQQFLKALAFEENLIFLLQLVSVPNINAWKAEDSKFIKYNTMENCICALILFVLRNPKNQQLILSNKNFREVISKLMNEKKEKIVNLTFTLICELYNRNYDVILNFQQDFNKDILRRLTQKVNDYLKLLSDDFNRQKSMGRSKQNKNQPALKHRQSQNEAKILTVKFHNQHFIYYLEFLTTLFQIKGKNLQQNQEFIRSLLQAELGTYLRQALSNLANQAISEKLEYQQFETSELEPIQNISAEMLVLITFFKAVRKLLLKGSNESINFARQIFPIQNLRTLIISNENFWPLKLEAMMFLTDIYICRKTIEDNEYNQIQALFKDDLSKQVAEFCRHLTQRSHFDDVYFVNQEYKNIFGRDSLYSSVQYLIQVNYFKAYEQYIVFGIMRGFLLFQEKIPDLISDIDTQLLVDYQTFIDRFLLEYFTNPSSFHSKSRHVVPKKRESKKNPTIVGYNFQKQGNQSMKGNDKGSSQETSRFNSTNIKDCALELFVQLFSLPYIKSDLTSGFKLDTDYQEIEEAFQKIPANYHKNFPIDEKQLEMEHDKELDILTQLLLQIKLSDSEKFKTFLQQYNKVLSSTEKSSGNSSKYAMIILRKISNYKQNMEIAESIQQDLCQLGFLKYLCQVIINGDEKEKLEYIIGMVDFLDEANIDIQENLYQYLQEDESNSFIHQLKDIFDSNFKQFKEFEKSKMEIQELTQQFRDFKHQQEKMKEDQLKKDQRGQRGRNPTRRQHAHSSTMYNYQRKMSSKRKQNLKKMNIQNFIQSIMYDGNNQETEMQIVTTEYNKVIHMKLQVCKQILELIRLSCENHFTPMQNYLRIQVNTNNKLKRNPINMIKVIADIFQKYTKIMNGTTIDFGIKILDTLIEMIQGPCTENQQALVNTKILENLEDIMFALHKEVDEPQEGEGHKSYNNKNKFSNAQISSVAKLHLKMLLFISSLFEGNPDPFILKKIQLFININLLFKLIQKSYDEYLKYQKEVTKKHKAIHYCLKQKHIINKMENAIMNCTLLEQKAVKEIEEEEEENLDPHQHHHPSNKSENTQEFNQLGKEIIYYQRSQLSINEGFSCYNLLQSLVSLSPEFEAEYNEQKGNLINSRGLALFGNNKENKAFQYFKDNCISIEIVNENNQLQKVFFRRPPITHYLSETTRIRFIENVCRDSSADKLNGLLEYEHMFVDEMFHILSLSALIKTVNLVYLTYIRNINLILIFIQNIFIISTSHEYNTEGQQVESNDADTLDLIRRIFGIIQLISAIIIWLLFVTLEMPVDAKRIGREYQQELERTGKEVKGKLWKYFYVILSLCYNSHLLYLSTNIAISVLGMFYKEFFYSFLMLDIIDRFQVLKNVIRSITQNFNQLIMTALLGGVILYIYAMIAFTSTDLRDTFLYANDKSIQTCQSAFECFLFILNVGLRQGGGIGDIIKMPHPVEEQETYHLRVVFDFSFFVIMIIIWMNIVFGIIIDTFAELRDDKKNRDRDQKNNCFICNISRTEYENSGVNFDVHTNVDHNLWHYIYYLQHLKHKDQNDFDGTESYVYEKYMNGDLSWFPVSKSMSLSESEEATEQQIILNQLSDINNNISNIQKKINNMA